MEGNADLENEAPPRISRGNLAPIEHFIIGGTPEANKERLSVESLLEQARHGDTEAMKKLLSPIRFQEGEEKDLTIIEEQRSNQEFRKGLRGGLPVLDDKAQTELAEERHLSTQFEPSLLDRETGCVGAEWKIYLTDSRRVKVNDTEVLSKLKISEDSQKMFYLEQVPSENYRLLRLRLSQTGNVPGAKSA